MNKTKKLKKTKRNKKKSITHKLYGGKVKGSGGYGCFLVPSVQCKNNTLKNKTNNENNISKLMLATKAKKEYNEIIKYKKILNTIPNHNKYFLINDIELCKPEKLTDSDLQDYETKCKALNKKKITKKNINKKLDSILAINMPYGGEDLDIFVKKCDSYDDYIELNKSLIDLLLNAIIPMNNKYIYHCDIKAANVLINKKYETRLIDWGLSTSYNNYNPNDSFPISRGNFNRPIQFNTPFSVIILNNEFKEDYEKYLMDTLKLKTVIGYADIRAFILKYFVYLNKEYKTGHIRYINKIMKMLFNENIETLYKEIKDDIVTTEYTYYYIIEYISKIVYKYTDFKNKKFDMQDYFKNVYLKTVDIWGFVFCYLPIITVFSNTKRKNLSNSNIKIYEKIKYMIIHYLYEKPLEPIETKEIIKELEDLDTLFKEALRENPNSLNSIIETYKKKINNNSDSNDNTSKNNTETAKLIQFFSRSSKQK
jgi:hypothetical protein